MKIRIYDYSGHPTIIELYVSCDNQWEPFPPIAMPQMSLLRQISSSLCLFVASGWSCRINREGKISKKLEDAFCVPIFALSKQKINHLKNIRL